MSLIDQIIGFRARGYNPNKVLNIIQYMRDHGKYVTAHAAPRMRLPRQCYTNATQCALNPKYLYVEGYVIPKDIGFPVEHAWIYDKDEGVYLDPTLPDSEGNTYFGIKFPQSMLLELAGSQELYSGNLLLTLSTNAFTEEKQNQYLAALDSVNL